MTQPDNHFPLIMQMVLLKQPASITAEQLEQTLNAYFSDVNATVQKAGDEAFMVEWLSLTFTVMIVNKPIPAETFDVALRTSYGLENGKALVDQHQAHLIVSPMQRSNDSDQSITMSGYCMYLIDALMNLTDPLAIFWSSSEILRDVDGFKAALGGFNQAMALNQQGDENAANYFPAIYWVGIRLYQGEQQGLVGAYSQGLENFMGYELDITPVAWSAEEVAQRLYGTIAFLFRYGDVLKDGETLGASETEFFRIKRLAATETAPARLLLSLEMDQ